TGLLAGTAVAASADPATGSSESLSGVPVAETLVRAVETVPAAEKPPEAGPAPAHVAEAASFRPSGVTAVRIVPAPTAAAAAVEAVAAAEQPAEAVPAPGRVGEAAGFGPSGCPAVRIVTEPTAAEAAVEARTEVAASRSNERTAAPAAEAQPAAAEAAPAQQA